MKKLPTIAAAALLALAPTYALAKGHGSMHKAKVSHSAMKHGTTVGMGTGATKGSKVSPGMSHGDKTGESLRSQ